MRIVIALGGNALLRRGETPTDAIQHRNVANAAKAVAAIARDHEVIVTHGNGPQVGLLALAQNGEAPFPLDVLDAESQGMIGYLLEQALRIELPAHEVVTLLTSVIVDPADPAFATPTKPIGPEYELADMELLATAHGWTAARDGDRYRRVVASPDPKAIVELAAIRLLLEHRMVVICAGGGGIPVATQADGEQAGVDAVIDKDLTAALLASELHAQALLLLTDVDAVYRAWGSPLATRIRTASPADLRAMSFAPGSMGPKVEAACRFVEAAGGFAAIGAVEAARELLGRTAGTVITT